MAGIKEKTGPDRENPFLPENVAAFRRWRDAKLARAEESLALGDPVEIRDLSRPGDSERRELARRCALGNAAFYACPNQPDEPERIRDQLRAFAAAMGLRIAERHRSAGRGGIVALTVSNAEAQRAYIPYSRRPMNWHTDGYYNAPDDQIRAMVLHCVRPARDGGVNQFLDPEIAYIRLRDANPDYIAALMHPEAMTIPQNTEPDGAVRPASVGPVFSTDPATGALTMRYTARTRSISWRDDPLTAEAVAFLNSVLNGQEPFIQTVRMEAGQGILCNNSLHNRTGFDPDLAMDSARLLFRIRFHNRVARS